MIIGLQFLRSRIEEDGYKSDRIYKSHETFCITVDVKSSVSRLSNRLSLECFMIGLLRVIKLSKRRSKQ